MNGPSQHDHCSLTARSTDVIGTVELGLSAKCSFSWSPDLEIKGDDAGDGASKQDGRFAGERFSQNLDAAGSGAAVNDVDLRERDVRKLFVAPEKRGRWREKANVQAIVAAFAVQEGDELIEAVGAAAGAAKGKTARGAIEKIGVADENAESGAARSLIGDMHGCFFNARRAAVGAQEHADAESFTRCGFALFEPGAFDGERFAAGDRFDAERDAVDFGRFEGIDKQARENSLHGEGDG